MSQERTGVELSVRNLCKRFGDLEILSDVNFEMKRCEFIAIVGRSGCGKSTFLSMLGGIKQPSSGEILVDGKRVEGIHPEMRVLFQDSRLLPWKKVIDNVRIGVKDGSRPQALKALRQVGLADKEREWPKTLSGGELQRVALARALSGSPRLLLLDEPLGALDALTRIEMQRLIENIWTEAPFNAILVTHDVSEAVALANRVILIENKSIGLDLKIDLSYPRERNSDFVYYEKIILDRLLVKRNPQKTENNFTI
jgi:sulfonate transport system ATP-binding protein